jgi:hypothetical protein
MAFREQVTFASLMTTSEFLLMNILTFEHICRLSRSSGKTEAVIGDSSTDPFEH